MRDSEQTQALPGRNLRQLGLGVICVWINMLRWISILHGLRICNISSLRTAVLIGFLYIMERNKGRSARRRDTSGNTRLKIIFCNSSWWDLFKFPVFVLVFVCHGYKAWFNIVVYLSQGLMNWQKAQVTVYECFCSHGVCTKKYCRLLYTRVRSTVTMSASQQTTPSGRMAWLPCCKTERHPGREKERDR